MKLKFRASGKDIFIFILFSIIVLFMVAIVLLNMSSFAKDNEFYGLNPIAAFSGEMLFPTIIGFVLVMTLIITSVSSYFFDREKGIGVTTEKKKESGYARWLSEKEMKKTLTMVKTSDIDASSAGMPIVNDGVNLWVDDSEAHSLIIGSTGSGKTQTMVLPLVESLAKNGESMVVTDPKGEIYGKTYNMLKDRGYNVVLLNFREVQKGNAWNPLTLPYNLYKEGNKDKAMELLDDLAANILYDEAANDPFWEKTSADYFSGLSLALFEDAKEDEINLNSINLMTTVGEDKVGSSTYIKEYFNFKEPSSPSSINVSSTINAPADTKGGILSVFRQKIRIFSSRENLSEMLSYSDFDIKDIGREKTAVFIVIQDEKKTYHSLVTIFIKQCYETLIDIAQENNGKLAYRTNFILDEFANMPPLKDVTTMVTAARSRNIRFNFIIQNFSQLYQVYGKENGETIKGNCGNIIYLISSELSALEEISKMCGEVKSGDKDKTASTPLVTVSDLQRLQAGEIVVLRTRMMPFKNKVTYDYQIDWGYDRVDSGYPKRDIKKISLFDIKSFVDTKREQKMNDLMKDINSGGKSSGFVPPPFRSNGMANKNKEFDLDAIVKRIDAKLAEIDKEEELLRKQDTESSNLISNKIEVPSLIDAKISEALSVNSNKIDVKNPVLTVDEVFNKEKEVVIPDSKILSTNLDVIEGNTKIDEMNTTVNELLSPKVKLDEYITDDQFFDDFFNDN